MAEALRTVTIVFRRFGPTALGEQNDPETMRRHGPWLRRAVELPHEHHAEQARLELDLYLRVWQSLHSWSQVEYVA